ncbi:hypothetical protein VaNZ11_004206 [Volvox africanus]|uniref:Uncharacterized protein n=1 Tax=Volvox africanus TaxID=51714 RepID=A0ABQ5RX20_9CHLO|nr:hypothetical protein VaNZ11_004206 [Volvox africanus]
MESLRDVGCRPCFATKAATAAKRLQAAGARCEANNSRTILNKNNSEGVGCAVNAAACVTAIAGAQVARPPVAPGAVICPAGGNIVGHPTGAGFISSSPTGRARLPGLRSLNGLGSLGSADAQRLGAALPLLLASTRGGGLRSQDSAVVAGPGQVPSVWRTSVPASKAAPCVFMSGPPTRSSHLGLTAGAFLPPPATLRMPGSNTSRKQAANPGMPVGTPDNTINHSAHGGSEDGAPQGANGGKPLSDSASPARAKAATPSPRSGCSTRTAIAKLARSYTTSTNISCRGRARRQENGTPGNSWRCNGSDGAGGDDGYGSGAFESGYSSARSSDSAMETEDADDYELRSPKRRRMEGNGERPAIAGGATAAMSTTASAGAMGSMEATAPSSGACNSAMVSASCDVVNAAAVPEPTGATAAVPVDSALNGRCTNYSYGPPWALMPRSGRVGELRCSLRAAQMLWPTLFKAARTEPQLVVLDVVVPSDGVHSGSRELDLSGVATAAVRALLRHDDKTMLLRLVEELPLGLCASVPVLLQISPHPNGEGAVIQLANRHVWAYYRARGGKLCCPGQLDASAAMAQTGGCFDSYDDSYVLQIRLGANLFGNRSFDVGIRAAERLFGHLVPGVQEVACAGIGWGPPGRGDCTDGRVAAASGLRQDNADAANSSGGGGNAADASEAAGVVAANANGKDRDPSRATWSVSFKRANDSVDTGNKGGNGLSASGGGGQGGGRPTVAAGRATASGSLPIHSLVITVIAEAWPEARSKVEFRYRFPRLLGMPNNAHHAYATLASNLVVPMVLYGAQPGDVFEMWRRPGGAPEEFLCRVVRSVVRGGKKKHVARGNGGVRNGICLAQGLEAAEAMCEH